MASHMELDSARTGKENIKSLQEFPKILKAGSPVLVGPWSFFQWAAASPGKCFTALQVRQCEPLQERRAGGLSQVSNPSLWESKGR